MARPKKRSESPSAEDVSRETSTPEYRPPTAPRGLHTGGRALWREIVKDHELDAAQRVQLLEACRAKDRLDELASIIEGKGVLELMHFRIPHAFIPGLNGEVTVEVKFDQVLNQANATANGMKQLLAALRLPDAAGKRPQQRGGARGAYVNGGADSGRDKPGSGGGSTLGNLRSITGGQSA
jgi:hypothetical protein